MLAYKGSVTTTGASNAMRFDKSLFKQHPEFRQKAKVEAHVIGQGTLLVHLVDEQPVEEQEDPMVIAFLSFIGRDSIANPAGIAPISESVAALAVDLTKDVVVSDSDDLPEDISI